MVTRAPLQLENLENEELLQRFCETRDELCALALWQRLGDRQLKSLARRICPRGYNPEWMERGSFNRAIKRFKKHICKFSAKLDTPSFGAYKKLLLKSAVIEEYRFVNKGGKGIFDQFGLYDVIDDSGRLIRTPREEDMDQLWEQLEHARAEDEREITGEEEEGEPVEQLPGEVTEEDERNKVEIAAFLEKLEGPSIAEPPPGPKEPPRGRHRKYVSRSTLRLLGVLAQSIPNPEAALGGKERKQIVKLLLLHHLTNEAKANSNDAIARFFFRDWSKARIAVLCYGEPPDVTVRNRHEKRVKDTLVHDLASLRKTLKTEFNITSLKQV